MNMKSLVAFIAIGFPVASHAGWDGCYRDATGSVTGCIWDRNKSFEPTPTASGTFIARDSIVLRRFVVGNNGLAVEDP